MQTHVDHLHPDPAGGPSDLPATRILGRPRLTAGMIEAQRRLRLPWSRAGLRAAVPALVLVLVSAGLLWRPFAHALEVWSTVSEFSFGYFVPLVSLGLVWWHREPLRRGMRTGSWTGLLLVGVALVVMLVGYRIGINVLGGLAVVPLLLGMAVYLFGWGAGQVLAFPISYLAFGLGLFRGLLGSVGFVMQGVTASGAALFGRALGLPVIHDGLILEVGPSRFIVAEACSGMSSLVSLLALSALFLHLMRASMLARTVVLLSVLPIVLLANITRVTTVLLTASWFGQETALAYFEKTSNLVLFGVALAGLLAISRIAGGTLPRRLGQGR